MAGLPVSVIMKPGFNAVVVLAAITAASVVAAEESHVRARLVADAGEIRPGDPFHLGVLLEPEPGWHVYWRNPGEAGLATEVLFDLPDGFEAGELEWPAPVSFTQPGDLAGYGYEEPVVLAAEVTAPDGVRSTTTVSVAASWLACKDVCVLGSAELRAELPLTGADLEASTEALEAWSRSLPVSAEPGRFGLSVTGGPLPAAGSTDLVVWLNWAEPPGAVELFPDPGPSLKVKGVRTQTRGSLTRVDLEVSRLKTQSPPAATLRALIVTENQGGDRSAVVSHIDLE